MKFLYNATIAIDKEIEQEWLQWMKSFYVPQAIQKGGFSECKIYKVVTHDDENTSSYSLQYFCDNIEGLVEFLNNDGKVLIEEHRERYKGRHAIFNTLLEEA